MTGASLSLFDMHLQTFLKMKGSPASHIEKCNITNEKTIEKLDFEDFVTR